MNLSGYFRFINQYRSKLTIAVLTALSAVLLAWSAALCLAGGIFRSLPERPEKFTIYVSSAAQGSPKNPSNGVAVACLIVDGSRLRAKDMQLNGTWQHGWGVNLYHPNNGEPASISFSAMSAAVLLDRTGACGHLSISGEAGRIWKDSCPRRPRHYQRFAAVDLPVPAKSSLWACAMWLAVFLAIAAAVRPWDTDQRMTLWLLIYLLALHLLFWSTQAVGVYSDSLNQLLTLRLNAAGVPAYFPPGYPLLVGAGHLISAAVTGSIVTFLQHLMMIIAIWWCFHLVRRCLGAQLAFLAALATGAALPTLALPQGIMSENVALFGMAGSLYYALLCRDRGRLYYAAISGLLLGWAGLARLLSPLAAGLPAVLVLMSSKDTGTAGIRRFSAVFAVVVFVLALPITWFGVRSGHFTLSSGTGYYMYTRIAMDAGLFDANAPATARFLRLIAPLQPQGHWHWEIGPILAKKGLNWRQINSMLQRVAWEGIRHAPMRYIIGSLRQAWTQYFADPSPLIPWAADTVPYTRELDSPPILGNRANSLLWREELQEGFADAWVYIPWLALAAFVLPPFLDEGMIFLALALIPFGYTVSTAFGGMLLSRFNAAIIPFMICLAAGPFAAVPRLLQTLDVAARLRAAERRTTD